MKKSSAQEPPVGLSTDNIMFIGASAILEKLYENTSGDAELMYMLDGKIMPETFFIKYFEINIEILI